MKILQFKSVIYSPTPSKNMNHFLNPLIIVPQICRPALQEYGIKGLGLRG